MKVDLTAISDPIETIRQWAEAVDSYQVTLSDESRYGELFATSGNLELDHTVAKILLNPVQGGLPAVSSRASNDRFNNSRDYDQYLQRKIPAIPTHLFTIDWGGAMMRWPEAYYVTAVPELGIKIVTESNDTDEMRGATDLAIGYCRLMRDPAFGCKKILQHWWRRGSGVEVEMWASVLEEGVVLESRAKSWGRSVFGSKPA